MKLPIQTSKYWHSYCCMSVFTVNSICIILKMCHAVIVWDLSLFLHSGCARWECRRKSVSKPPWCGNAVTFTQKINKGNIVLGHLCTYWKMSHPLFWFSSALFDVSDFFFCLSVSLANVMWKLLHIEERQVRPSCILSHPGLILHFSCCVLLTAGVSSVQSRPFHCALCWEWWQSDDTALIKSCADF